MLSQQAQRLFILIGGEKMEQHEIPVGFTMTLAQNPKAMEKFALLSEAEKRQIIAEIHSVNSKAEMHRYVSRIASDESYGATM